MAFKSKRAGGDSEDYKPCRHLLDYKANCGTQAFRVLHKCLKPGPPGRASIKREEKEVPRCATCGKAQGRLYACLMCATIGCWVPPDQLHSRLHAQTKPGHDLAVDVDRAELFCCLCNDQVYDADFDRAVIGAQTLVALAGRVNGSQNGAEGGSDINKAGRSSKGGLSLKNSVGNGSRSDRRDADEGRDRKRRKGAEYRSWVPSPSDLLSIRQGSTPLVEDCLPSGLRGLNNLGNTCFMNSVLQALLHTPPLRNYFLSDRHNRTICQQRAAHLCLGCDMDTIFSAAFSGERSPYSPAQFLYSWWRHAANLAGYEQQDAHEFFISTVDGIHANSGTESPRDRNSETGRSGDVDCRCIVHRVFSGLLRSDVTCTVCGFTSTTYDPCVDISLDLEPDIRPDSKIFMDSIIGNYDGGRLSRGSTANGITGNSTLLGCLDRFTRPERLGANEKFYCQRCQTRQESIKQMSIRKLPLVLCFHIKRFEHSSTKNTSRKVDRYVQFPFSLDMAPYISSSIVRSRHGNRLLFLESEEMWASQCPSTEFELFAVVTHSGKLDSGHYVSFIRLAGEWYKCDDAWVTRVSEEVVRACQGYMLYYVLKTLSYKSSDENEESPRGNESEGNGNHGYTWSSSGVTNGT
ncbi:hypothetical protein R1flu_002400 [Riccia fluitans]|uniref:Ubiquitin carboxyl-terminal hydrolase n=1 Tax=Riccia fluitans TaxID=41844 RepID=A0ABD1Y664_9MARC